MTDTPETDAEADNPRNIYLDGQRSERRQYRHEIAKEIERQCNCWKAAHDLHLRMLEDAVKQRDEARKERDATVDLLALANESIKDMRQRVTLHRKAADDLGKDRDDLRAENQRLAKIIADLEAIREMDC